jgi:hypothetical protein
VGRNQFAKRIDMAMLNTILDAGRRRTSHHERTRRNADHLRTFTTFAKLTILLFACVADICQHDECNTGTEHEFDQALNHKACSSLLSPRRKIATHVHCGPPTLKCVLNESAVPELA